MPTARKSPPGQGRQIYVEAYNKKVPVKKAGTIIRQKIVRVKGHLAHARPKKP